MKDTPDPIRSHLFQEAKSPRILTILNLLVLGVIFTLCLFLGFKPLMIFLHLMVACFCISSIALAWKGRDIQATWCFVLAGFLATQMAFPLNGGLKAPGLAALSVPILLAGGLIGKRAMILIATATSALIVLVAWLDHMDYLPPPQWEHGPWSRAFLTIAIVVAFTLAAWWISSLVQNSQEHLRKELQERKHAEQQVRQMNAVLEERVRERTKDLEAFTSMVSHDLRGPLRHSMGYARILQEDKADQLDQEANQYLDRIVASSQRMTVLIDSLLAFSRIGHAALKWDTFEMSTLVREVWNLIDGSGYEIQIDELGTVTADRQLLAQVWQNLLENAVKYSRGVENPAIRVSQETIEGATWFVLEDNGLGFDPKYADKIFEMFSRAHSGPEQTGNGVGLAIVSRIIQCHEGEIRASGQEGKGAKFMFRIGTPNISK